MYPKTASIPTRSDFLKFVGPAVAGEVSRPLQIKTGAARLNLRVRTNVEMVRVLLGLIDCFALNVFHQILAKATSPNYSGRRVTPRTV